MTRQSSVRATDELRSFEADGFVALEGFHAGAELSELLVNVDRFVQDVVPKNLQYFDKPAGSGQPTPPHQDGYYFMLDPCEAVTVWIALEPADEEIGCVRYVRGSHERGLREHARTRTLGFSQGILDYPTGTDAREEVAVPAQAGNCLAHSALTIHRADGNSSNRRSRRALGFIYYGDRAREDREAHQAYRRRLAEDWKTEGRI